VIGDGVDLSSAIIQFAALGFTHSPLCHDPSVIAFIHIVLRLLADLVGLA
jgi:hypothetical protein